MGVEEGLFIYVGLYIKVYQMMRRDVGEGFFKFVWGVRERLLIFAKGFR